jgi:hypothetical protein
VHNVSSKAVCEIFAAMAPSVISLSVATGLTPEQIDALMRGDETVCPSEREVLKKLFVAYERSIKAVTFHAARTRILKL